MSKFSGLREIPIDAVIYCTGYQFDFAFLDKKSIDLTIDDWRITPLYQHMVHIEEPTLFFIGLCCHVVPFPFFSTQVQYAAAILSGKSKLPTRGDMIKWQEDDFEYRRNKMGLPHKKAHYMDGCLQWTYLDKLAELGNFKLDVPPILQKINLCDHVIASRKADLLGYQYINYELLPEGHFAVVMPKN